MSVTKHFVCMCRSGLRSGQELFSGQEQLGVRAAKEDRGGVIFGEGTLQSRLQC